MACVVGEYLELSCGVDGAGKVKCTGHGVIFSVRHGRANDVGIAI